MEKHFSTDASEIKRPISEEIVLPCPSAFIRVIRVKKNSSDRID